MGEFDIVIQDNICKSITGEEDENGNYKFEVEASNENLDLQNQITLQSALEKSQEYFVTNGVVSDDHLHKTRNPDGTVETHKEKIIGEPVSVRFDTKTKKTFVKGILYSGIEAAKPYIDLLKNKSKLVKASIGGIMPHIKKNADGTETVTSFMWNDLALTTSPVNWTVGSAKFAKSIGIVDFCKSLNAGGGTDSAEFEGGRSLQKEDIEEETKEIIDITDGDISGESEKDDFEKSDQDEDVIKETVIAIETGELKSINQVINFLCERGFDKSKAKETAKEIISQGGRKMGKSFSSKVNDLIKSLSPDKEGYKKGDEEETEDSESLFDDDLMENESETDTEDDEETSVKKCGVKKSFDENDEFVDATDLVKSMGDEMADLRAENEALRNDIKELQDNVLSVTKSFTQFLNEPVGRETVVSKSIGNGDAVKANANPKRKPTKEDFDMFKKSIVQAAKNGSVGVDEVQFLNSEFQKSMKGEPMTAGSWNKICQIVRNNQ